MGRPVIAIIVMLAAPILVLLTAAHTGLFSGGAVGAYFVLISAWAIVAFAIWSARWSRRVTVGLTIAYTVAAIPVLPFAGLLAVCSTGDCI
jgi:hypothetical protein